MLLVIIESNYTKYEDGILKVIMKLDFLDETVMIKDLTLHQNVWDILSCKLSYENIYMTISASLIL